jgi:hypothetical protein
LCCLGDAAPATVDQHGLKLVHVSPLQHGGKHARAFTRRNDFPAEPPNTIQLSECFNTACSLAQKARGSKSRTVKDAQENLRVSLNVYNTSHKQLVWMLSILNPNAAGASYENGILTLRLPKTQAARARQIPIRTASQLESGPLQTP